MGSLKGALAGLSLLLIACSEDPRPTPAESVDPPEAPSAVDPPPESEAPAPEPSAPDPAPAPVVPSEIGAAPPAPEAGCAFGTPSAIAAGQWGDVARADDGFVAATSSSEGTRETLSVWRLEAGAEPTRLSTHALTYPVPSDRRRAGPALSAEHVAWVDGERSLFVAPLSRDARPTRIGGPASLRFSPALVLAGDVRAVAWTDDSGTPMRVRGRHLRPSGEPTGEAADLTPEGGGGAAPSALGASIVFLDPRAAMSVAHRAEVGTDGFAPTTVARPVGLVTAPPVIAALGDEASPWLAFTLVGAAATTAVGLVELGGAAPARPIVPGTGYGTLHVDGDGRVVAADAPRDRPPDAPREIHVHVVGDDGALGEAAVITGPGGSGRRGRVAVGRDGVAVLFIEAGRAYVSFGRCRR